jgi:hypothetical protein
MAWSAAGLILYAPIPLFAAFPKLAPAALQQTVRGAPLSVWLVAGVIVSIVLLTWACGAGGEGDERTKAQGEAK